MREKVFVERVSRALGERWHVNVHGSTHGRRGVADVLTVDSRGVLVALEVKQVGEHPVVNQLRDGIRVLRSGGRYVVVRDGFSVEGLDGGVFPKVVVDCSGEVPEFDGVDFLRAFGEPASTYEVVMGGI